MKFSISAAALLVGALPSVLAAPAADTQLARRQVNLNATVTYCTDPDFKGACYTQTFPDVCANIVDDPTFKNAISSIRNELPDPGPPGPEFRDCTWFTGQDCTGDGLHVQNVPDLSTVEYGKFDNNIASLQCFRNRHT